MLTVVAEDVDENDDITAYALPGGSDHRRFTITSPGGVLSFRRAPDYGRPTDADRDNLYEVIVEATSGTDNLTSYQKIQVEITDIHDPDDCFGDRGTLCSVTTNWVPLPAK